MIAFAVILLVLVLIGILPVGALVQYDGEATLRVMAGPFGYTLFPQKKRTEKQEVKRAARAETRRLKAEKKAETKKETAEKAPKRAWTLQELRPLIEMGLELVQGLPKKLLVQNLTLHITFGGRDAASAAIGYGRAWAVIGTVMPVLESNFRIQNSDVDAILDYSEESLKIFLRLDIRMRVGTGVLLALKSGVKLLKIIRNNKKGGATINESSSIEYDGIEHRENPHNG